MRRGLSEFVDALAVDLKHAARSIRSRRLSSLAIGATLAVGIGLNAAVFSVFDWVLLRPLPYPSPEQLVRIFTAGANPVTAPAPVTASEFTALASAPSLRSAAAFSSATRVLAAPGVDAFHVVVARVSGDLFGTLNIAPIAGRAPSPAEITRGESVAVITEAMWRTRFGSASDVIGRTVTIDGRPHIVIGVMPARRGYPADADLWRPLTAAEREDDDREQTMIARLAAGRSADEAGAELAAIAGVQSKATRWAWAEDVQRSDVRDVRAALTMLVLATSIVLLIACANIAALVAAGAADRAAELAVRGALGASRGRLVRPLVAESVLLSLAGGAGGLLLGSWTLSVLVSIAPRALPRLAEVSLDGRIIAFGVLVPLAVAAVVAFWPSISAARPDLRRSMSRVEARSTAPRSKTRLALVAAQTALTALLLSGAVLLGKSLQYLVTIDHGFVPDRLVAVDLYLRGGPAGDVRRLFRDLVTAAEATSGVRSAAVSLRLPTEQTGLRVPLQVDGEQTSAPAVATLRPVTPHYFETTGIPITRGRGLTADDRQGAPLVGLVNAAFVRDVLGSRPPLGIRLRTQIADAPISIVGITGDVTPTGQPDRPALYVALDQIAVAGGSLLVRTAGAPEAVVPLILAHVHETAPALALDRVQTVDAIVGATRAVTRFNAQLASGFAAIALLLAAIGVYGLTAGEVAGRWRELAVRMALGASRRRAFWSVCAPATFALAAGLIAGVGLVPALRGPFSALLPGTSPVDAAALAGVPLMLGVAGLTAASLGARRVLRADPAATLRGE